MGGPRRVKRYKDQYAEDSAKDHEMRRGTDDGCHVVIVLSDGMDIFVLVVYWTWCCDLQGPIAFPVEKWDSIVLDVNDTCAYFGVHRLPTAA